MAEEIMPELNASDELLTDSEYSRKSEFSKATMVQTQVSRCLELRSKDMRPGYTTWVAGATGSPKPVIVPDSRKEYVSGVEALKNVLSPEADLKMPYMDEIYENAKNEIFNKYAYREKVGKKWEKEKAVWIYSGRIFMPQKGAAIMCNTDKPQSVGVSNNPHLWDTKIDAYWDEVVIIADDLFAELNRLIHILDYFKGGSSL